MQLLEKATPSAFDRVLLIARHGFTRSALELASHAIVSLELLSLDDSAAWIDRVEAGTPKPQGSIVLIVRTMSHGLALAVARNPEFLDLIEWRDFERMVGRILEGLGFTATVTRPSKDGGKDIILECSKGTAGSQAFIVEVKHWVSGKKVGKDTVTEFVQVVATEKRDGGVLLSTSGFASDAFSSLTSITRERVRFGDRTKVTALAQKYERASLGLWSVPSNLAEVLFEHTE